MCKQLFGKAIGEKDKDANAYCTYLYCISKELHFVYFLFKLF